MNEIHILLIPSLHLKGHLAFVVEVERVVAT